MENRDRQVLSKIIEETNMISKLLSDMDYETFSSDEKTKRAVCMTLINIGELVKNLSDGLKQANPTIPYFEIFHIAPLL